MKVATRTGFNKLENFDETINFTIKPSAKAFGALIKGLYAHPITSITRELSTNAWDSHIKAKNDKPFSVHLPTWSEPTWYIRDYGVGLSPKDIEQIYTIMFESDKADSNEYTGCLGLGSKTPFAYSQNFMIESWINGTHYIYNAFIDNEGKPCIAILDKNGQLSKEPNGVKISIAVKQNDIQGWIDAASKIYRYFKVKPCFIGHQLQFRDYDVTHKGNDWRIVSGGGSAKIVMGNIAYPIKYEHVKHTLVNHGIELDCNIGDVSIEISREGLHYDKKTVMYITNKLTEIAKEISVDVQKEFDKCNSLWQANKFVLEYKQKLGDISNVIIPSLLYKGKPFTPQAHYSIDKFDFYGLNWNGNISKKSMWSLNLTSRTIIAEAVPTDKKANGRIKFAFNGKGSHVYIFRTEDAVLRQKILDDLGLIEDDIVKSNTLPDPPPTVNTSVRRKLSKISTLSDSCFYMSSSWNRQEVDIDTDGGVYVETQKFKWKKDTDWYTPIILSDQKKAINRAGIKLDLIYGIRSSIINKVKDKKHWVPFDEFVQTDVKKQVISKNWHQIKYYQDIIPHYWAPDKITKLLGMINPKCTLGLVKDELLAAFKQDSTVLDNMIYLNNIFKFGAPTKIVENNPFEKYKLFPREHSSSSDFWTQLVNYINSI